MKKIPGILLVFTCFYLSYLPVFSQATDDDLKLRRKSSSSYIAISYEDITGGNIPVMDERVIEQIFNACGDKKVIEEIILRKFLGKGADSTEIAGDSVFNRILGPCPHFGKTRGLDPLFLSGAFMLHRILKSGKPFEDAYSDYLAWQSKNMPNSMLGNNEAPETLQGVDLLKWYLKSGKNWVETYPGDFKRVLDDFNLGYNAWKIDFNLPDLTPSEYVVQLVDSTKVQPEEEIRFNLNWDPGALPPVKITLPSMENMRRNPEKFINEMYETLLMRKPSPQETSFLTASIKKDKTLSPLFIYFALMTSNEYKYY